MKQIRSSNYFLITTAIFFGLFVTLLGGCATQQAVSHKDAPVLSAGPQEKPDYIIQEGDELDIKFFYNPELNEALLVRPDGKISIQLLDDVQAAGLTPSQLDEFLTQEYSRELSKPVITVIVRSFSGQQVYVGGEVTRPGLVDFTSGLTALQAVFSVEGFKETAKPSDAIVIRRGLDNRPVPIRVDLHAYNGNILGAGFQLQPSDVVYVPKTFIAKANKFVNQYIEDLFLFRGVSMGFAYRLDNKGDN